MTAVSGSNASAVTDRCLQLLQFAKGTISAVLQTALLATKSAYHLVWPQLVKSLAGEIVLVCLPLYVFCAALRTAGVTLQDRVVSTNKVGHIFPNASQHQWPWYSLVNRYKSIASNRSTHISHHAATNYLSLHLINIYHTEECFK
jgi:hypothetical protein